MQLLAIHLAVFVSEELPKSYSEAILGIVSGIIIVVM